MEKNAEQELNFKFQMLEQQIVAIQQQLQAVEQTLLDMASLNLGLDEIKPGHKIVYRLFRISLEKVGIQTFERVVKKVENFSSKKDLLSAYPDIKITPSFHLPKWKQKLGIILGNIIYPTKTSYTLFWFKELEKRLDGVTHLDV